MLRRPPGSTRTDTLFPTRRSSDLALPAAAVVAGLSTVVIAVRASGDDAIPESIRRTAQMQEADLAADQQALQRHLRASVQLTRSTGAVQDRKSTRLNSSH